MLRLNYSESKITVPQLHHKLLQRKNIAAIIDNAALSEAICVIAPYGCGKTLAVVSWLREHNLNAAWITFDEADNSEKVFWAGLSAAILRLTGWEGVAEDILTDAAYTQNPRGFFMQALAKAEKNNSDKVLVMDRLYFIRDLTLLRSVKEMVSALLGSWRIVIISRAEMPAVFNDLILKRQICLITLNELDYSLEETAEFLSMNGCEASAEDVRRIHEETEGWPAAINVIFTISRGRPVEFSDAARDYITDFFETEIWSGLDKNIRDFLIQTSILDKLTPAACNAVTDRGATLPILRWLFVNGLFLFKINGNDAYRYHGVFRNFLLHKLKLLGFDEKELYKKIAWWMFERDEFEKAFPYFFKAGDLYGLSRVFRILNSAETGMERYLELVECITELKIEDLRDYPLIVAKIALIHYVKGNISEMQRLYNIYIEWIEPGALSIPPEEYAECVWEAGWLSYLNPAEPILNNKHEEWLNYTEYDSRLQAMHHIRIAVYRFPSVLRGVRDYCPVLDTIEEYIQQNKESGYSTIDNTVSLWRLDIVRAEYAYELENFALAEELIKNIIIDVEDQLMADLYFACVALLVKIIRAVYNPKEVDALTKRLEAMIIKSGYTFLLPSFHAFELHNRLAQGIPGQTEVFEKENQNYIDKPYFYLLFRHMTLARALLSTGDYNEAAMLLGNLERLCYRYNRVMDLVEINNLKAIAEYGLDNDDRACRYITEALDKARRYGFIRIFSDDAKDIWPILELLDEKNKDNYVKNVIISCKKALKQAGIKIHRKNYEQSELTKTELKILKMLDTGMSYNELALDNGIKISTVKSHIRSIYSKLDVDNKTSAIITARHMGIID